MWLDFLFHLPLAYGQVERRIADAVPSFYKLWAGGEREVEKRGTKVPQEFKRISAKMNGSLGYDNAQSNWIIKR